MDSRQYQVYLGWINAQLKKKKEPRLIEGLEEMTNGTVFADLIEVVAGEQLEVFPVPVQHCEKVANMDRVLRFMKAKRIPMHPINAEDVVSGDIRSIMRLVLALAARYKPNTVKQTSSRRVDQTTSGHMSVLGYAQSAVTVLADARRKASVIIPRPKKPSNLNDCGDGVSNEPKEPPPSSTDESQFVHPSLRLPSLSLSNSQSVPTSSSQDFSRHSARTDKTKQTESDVKYQDLMNAYQKLDSEHKELRLQSDHMQSIYHDLTTDTRICGRMLLSLKQLLETEEEPSADDPELLPSDADGRLAIADAPALNNRLVLSEESCSDVKEDLSKKRKESLRLQGAEVELNQRLLQHQKNRV